MFVHDKRLEFHLRCGQLSSPGTVKLLPPSASVLNSLPEMLTVTAMSGRKRTPSTQSRNSGPGAAVDRYCKQLNSYP